MSNWTPWLIICLLSVFAILQAEANVNLSKHKLNGILKWKFEKRPFCNAFTGCGKKRSPYPPFPALKRSDEDERSYPMYNNEIGEELSDLIDINAEPAVENVQKQIMSQAKIFEAIKEASKEIFRQKNKQRQLNQQRKEQQQQNQDQQYLQEQNEQQDSGRQQLDKMEDGEIV